MNCGPAERPRQSARMQRPAPRKKMFRNEKYPRRQLNEFSSDGPMMSVTAEKFSMSPLHVPVATYYSANTSQLLAFNPEGRIQGYQAFKMSLQADSAFLKYNTEAGDHTQQYYVPASKAVVQAPVRNMSAYQIHSPSSSPPQEMTSPPAPLLSLQQKAEQAKQKKELRLLKNREAARECRRKKKEYVKCLENRVAVLENQNKMLIEELKALKDLEAAKKCRLKKKEYICYLEVRLSMLELENKMLMDEVQFLRNSYPEVSH